MEAPLGLQIKRTSVLQWIIAANCSLSGSDELQQLLRMLQGAPIGGSYLACTIKGQFLVRWSLSTRNLDFGKTWTS